jgi:glycine cleavage system H protein
MAERIFSMPAPSDRRYANSHEWHKQDGDVVTIGITQFAVDELTDITYVDLPQKGKQLIAGKTFGEIESVKATSELYTAISGEVIEANAALKDDPSLVNQDPYGKGWMIKVKAPGAKLEGLMTGEEYNARHS